MRKLIVLSAIAILASASPALAINATFTVSGHLGVATSAGKCTSLAYPAMCPSANCVCYTATKTSLHTAKGGLLTIPPGTTQVAVSVDTADITSHPGCAPAWGEVHYVSSNLQDSATIEFFASLCKPLAAGFAPDFFGRRRPDRRHVDRSTHPFPYHWDHRSRDRHWNILFGGCGPEPND